MSKQNLTVLIITFITVVAWIAFDIYHANKTTTIAPEYQSIQPISSSFDLETLDDVDSLQSYELYNLTSQVQE